VARRDGGLVPLEVVDLDGRVAALGGLGDEVLLDLAEDPQADGLIQDVELVVARERSGALGFLQFLARRASCNDVIEGGLESSEAEDDDC